MDVQEAIFSRRSIREYAGRPVEPAAIERLLEAAVAAPSATNAQTWAFGILTDPSLLDELSAATREHLLAHLDEMPALQQYREMLSSPDYHVFYHAPALVVIYATPTGPAAEINCALAAENLMLAARGMGLGTCWIGFAGFLLNRPEWKQRLGVPEDCQAVAPIIVGHPAEQPESPEKRPPQVLYRR